MVVVFGARILQPQANPAPETTNEKRNEMNRAKTRRDKTRRNDPIQSNRIRCMKMPPQHLRVFQRESRLFPKAHHMVVSMAFVANDATHLLISIETQARSDRKTGLNLVEGEMVMEPIGLNAKRSMISFVRE